MPSLLKERIIEYRQSVLVALGWGTILGAATLWAVLRGELLPYRPFIGTPLPQFMQYHFGPLDGTQSFYLIFFSVSVLSSMMVRDFEKSLLAFLMAYIVTASVTFEFLSAPGISGSNMVFTNTLANQSLSWTFTALFPVPFFIGFFGTVVGVGLHEKYLA